MATPKTKTKKKYIESHWLIFGIQGIVALAFGLFVMFTDLASTPRLVTAVGIVLAAIGLIEAINVVSRHRHQYAWGLSLAIAIIEIAVAVALLTTRGLSVVVPFTIIAGYTLLRGIFEVLIAIRSLKDSTDRFLWIVTGMFGMILGFIIFNSGNIDLANTTFIKLFGTYMMVFGLANIVFSVHSRNTLAKGK